ncbi:MAG: hypothetical protein RBU30_10055 [Polyangia bacterium]|jgi:hypothetical protein|nr:hypothetical protein [Polyangia bacterium]
MDGLLDIFRAAGLDFVAQVATLFGALGLVALLLHLVERRISRRLAHRFGWRSVLVTGWLGVPLHELSHLVACLVFRHRVVAFSLFDPDPRTGTLGYVQHSYRKRSPYQLAGSFFIGVAPLVGGALVLFGALWALLPSALPAYGAPLGADIGAQLAHTAAQAGVTLGGIFTLEHAGSLAFWAFLLIALCVGSHLSPSRPDLQGAWPGLLLLLGALFALNLTNRAFGLTSPGAVSSLAASVLAPLLALLALALCLQLLLWLAVELLVWLTTPRRGLSLGYEEG